MDAATPERGTRVEVETSSGCFRGTLIQPLEEGSDIELRYAGHYIRLHWWSVRKVRPLTPLPPRR